MSECAVSEDEVSSFNAWKMNHKKSYSATENQKRFQIFQNNSKRIKEINSIKRNFTVGLNQYADLNKDEFASLYLGSRKKQINPWGSSKAKILHLSNNFSLDWREKKAVTSVKAQGACAASWAFATTGALEGFAALQRGEIHDFSAQQLIDCSGSYGNQGCQGGSMQAALNYTADQGVMLEKDYKYTGINGICKYNKNQVNFKNHNQLVLNSDAELMVAIRYGPVAAFIQADHDFIRFYASGILDSEDCGFNVNHGVLVAGYGVKNTMGYWIVKNSWGAQWGEQGYLKIARAQGVGICGINYANVIPLAEVL